MEFLVSVDGKLYEISELITKVTYTDRLNDGCSKLEFSYINDDLVIANGSAIRFKYNNANIFNGIAFKVSRSDEKEITVTAYDQLRYCKAKDSIVISDAIKETATDLVKKMCNRLNLKFGNLENAGYVLPLNMRDDNTWLDIIYKALSDTLVSTGKKYALRDEFGLISLRNLENLKTNLILGDKSLCYGFDYEKSIDEDFYNLVKLASDNEKTGKRDTFITKDSGSINKYGLLQYFEVLDKNANISQAKAKADALLSLYNREYETLSLACIGDTSIRAGNSFYAYISDIGLNKRLLVKEATHTFLPNHTMSLEVSI